jgi:hypothetical protein
MSMIGLMLVMFNVGGMDLVDKSNVGLWQRGYSLAAIPWIGLACLGLDQALGRRSNRTRDPMRDVVFGDS